MTYNVFGGTLNTAQSINPGCPGQNPESRKMVVCVCVCAEMPHVGPGDLGLLHFQVRSY